MACMPVALLAVLLIGSGTGNAAPAKVAPAAQCGSWQTVASPNTPAVYNALSAVSAASSKSVWAVGQSLVNGTHSRTLIEDWNGTKWSMMTSPNPIKGDHLLSAVSADASNDVWAVGISRPNPTGSITALVEHYDGSAWSVVTIPDAASYTPNAVVAISPSDVWIAGGISQSLVEHWNGSSWTIVQDATPSNTGSSITGMSALASNDVWATGEYLPAGSNHQQTFVEHWDGTTWTLVPSLNRNSGSNYALSISEDAANDVWVAGYTYDFKNNDYPVFVEHWNGTKWAYTSVPDPTTTVLFSIQALSSSNVWAVGNNNIEHWNGTKWSIVSTQTNNYLYGITRVPGKNTLWSVGFTHTATNDNTLIESYC